jgi:hypothetical protein
MPNDTSVCVTVFNRTDKLANLLNSINDSYFEKVYIADDGKITEKKEKLYSKNFDFDIELIDIEYDRGVGYKRRQLAEVPNEEYLFYLDADMELPSNHKILRDQIQAKPDLGLVGGMYMSSNSVGVPASDLFESNNVLYRDIKTQKQIQKIAGEAFVEFDFIPHYGYVRKACALDYTWDPNYKIFRDHIDFFLGHKNKTDWEFGISPKVLIPHYQGGYNGDESGRYSGNQFQKDHNYFVEKWDLNDFVVNTGSWMTSYDPSKNKSKLAKLADIYEKNGIIRGSCTAIAKLINKSSLF